MTLARKLVALLPVVILTNLVPISQTAYCWYVGYPHSVIVSTVSAVAFVITIFSAYTVKYCR